MTGQQKKAPVQGYSAGIPWSLHLEAYDAYCKCYGPQPALIDLEGRNCRGGFSTRELDDFVPGWRDRVSEIARLQAQVDALARSTQLLMVGYRLKGWEGDHAYQHALTALAAAGR